MERIRDEKGTEGEGKEGDGWANGDEEWQLGVGSLCH